MRRIDGAGGGGKTRCRMGAGGGKGGGLMTGAFPQADRILEVEDDLDAAPVTLSLVRLLERAAELAGGAEEMPEWMAKLHQVRSRGLGGGEDRGEGN